MSDTRLPAIPLPTDSIDSLLTSVMALKQAVEMLTGASGAAVLPAAVQTAVNSTVASTYIVAVNKSINDLSTYINTSVDGAIAEAQAALNTEITNRTSADTVLQTSITSLTSTVNNNTAAISSEAVTRANADGSLAGTISSLSAGSSAGVATGKMRLSAVSGSEGVATEFSIQLSADSGSSYAATGMRLQAMTDGTSRVVFDTSQFMVRSGSSSSLPPFTVTGGNIVANSLLVPTANITGTLTANQINVSSLSALNANLGTVTAGLARDANSKFNVDFTNARLSVYD